MPSESPPSDDAADPLLEPGTMVGEYRVDRPIGKGTFGDVYAGQHPIIGKRVAIKVLRRKMSENPEAVARFIAEARAVNRVRHRNIVDVFAFGTVTGERHYFVMELLEGLTLGELLERETRIAFSVALPILQGVAEALDAAHAAGIIHRDLKPENVFLVQERDGGYTPKLLDFGVAKLLTEEMGVKTATGVAIGTPRYMSPEQARGRKIDHRTDIYALGVLTHEILTGFPPFEAKGTVELLLQHTVNPPPRMSVHNPDLWPELDGPVLAMLAKQPAERPASAGKAIAALAVALNGASTVRTQPLGTRIPEQETTRDPPPQQQPAAEPMPMKTVLMGDAPAAAPVGGTVLLDTPTIDVRGRKPAAPAAPPQPANVAFAPTMVSPPAGSVPPPASSGTPSLPISAADLPRSNLGPIVAAIGAAVVLLVIAAVFALRGKGPGVAEKPALPAVSAPSPAVTPPPAPTTIAPSAAPSVVPAEVAPAPTAAATQAAAPSSPAPASTHRPAAKGTAAPARGKRDIGF